MPSRYCIKSGLCLKRNYLSELFYLKNKLGSVKNNKFSKCIIL